MFAILPSFHNEVFLFNVFNGIKVRTVSFDTHTHWDYDETELDSSNFPPNISFLCINQTGKRLQTAVYLANREALTVLCSVVEHAESS